MRRIFFYTTLFFLLLGTWLLLTLPVSIQELLAGAAGTLLVLLFTRNTLSPRIAGTLSIKTFIWGIPFIVVFLIELVKSNLNVALIVLHPTLPINPGIVKVTTRLTSPLGRLILANAITLTPGTLTVETDGNALYIHWITITAPDITSATTAIVSKFEKYLGVMFG